jgi:hypothetical protein
MFSLQLHYHRRYQASPFLNHPLPLMLMLRSHHKHHNCSLSCLLKLLLFVVLWQRCSLQHHYPQQLRHHRSEKLFLMEVYGSQVFLCALLCVYVVVHGTN